MSTFIDLVQNDLNKEKMKKRMKNLKPNLSKRNGRTCKQKGYYYNQCRQRQCCSNNGRLKTKTYFQKTADGLKYVNPKAPEHYISRRIHKENNPGRPVM